MSLERVKQHLKKYGLDGKIILCDDSSATVALAAAALGCEEARIGKKRFLSIRRTAVCLL